MQRLPQEWKCPGDKKVLRTWVVFLQGPPCSVDIESWHGSPALSLQRNHSILQQALVYVRLEEPRVGVLQETASCLTLPLPSQVQSGISGASYLLAHRPCRTGCWEWGQLSNPSPNQDPERPVTHLVGPPDYETWARGTVFTHGGMNRYLQPGMRSQSAPTSL